MGPSGSFVASVQEVMRAEGKDQIDWAARRRRRFEGAMNSSSTNRPVREGGGEREQHTVVFFCAHTPIF